MSKVISLQSTNKYAGQNATFALFCYHSDELRDVLLEPWFIAEIGLFATEYVKQRFAKDCCVKMCPDDNNCPFILSNLTFAQFSDFITQRKARRGKGRGTSMSLGNASYEQSQSALKHLFCMSKYVMQTNFFDDLKQFTKGIRRHVADKKVLEGDVTMVGKKKMGYDVYKKLCEKFLEEEGEEYIFARAFLTLEWNLMARSENVVNAHILHVHWDADCLVFRFVKSKGDQTGKNRDQEWHVYANPHTPAVCPVLALGCYIFENPGVFLMSTEDVVMMNDGVEEGTADGPEVDIPWARHSQQKGRLFPGKHQYDRFMGCLHRILEKHSDDFFALGISPGDLGSHSARKGASSHASSGTTVSPPMVSICLRAMWSMGHVKERYLQFEKAGDQYLGRVVCGLDVNDVKFAVSPPYFDFDVTDLSAEDGTDERVFSLLRDYMVGGDYVCASVHRIFYFCFASLSFHFDFLSRVLHPMNKLRASHFFNHIPLWVKNAATVKYPWTRTDATPTLTGLPPHITILANFEKLRVELEDSKVAILGGIEAELDKRRIGSQSHFDKEEILDRMLNLHNELLKKVDACGRESASAVQNAHFAGDGDGAGFDDIFVSPSEEETDKPLTIVPSNRSKKFTFFYSKGEVNRIPHDYVFPHMTLCTLVTSWFCGNPSAKTLPLKYLVWADFKSKKMKNEHRKMKVMMGAVIAGANQVMEMDCVNGAWDIPRALQLYGGVKELFAYPSKSTQTHRNDQISWRTVYNLYLKNGKRFATDTAIGAVVEDNELDVMLDGMME